MERALCAGVAIMIVTGSSVDESQQCITFAERYPEYLYATCGVHPHLAKDWQLDTIHRLRSMAAHPKIVAIGETGLDYHRNYSPAEKQRYAFEQQVELACELKMPLFLHQREAHDDLLKVLSHYRKDIEDAVVHCFTGTETELAAYLELDLHVGITGWICDERRGQHLHALVKDIPVDRLMIETDAPYLLPRDLQPQPKGRRNEPAYLPHILGTIARHKGIAAATLAQATTHNSIQFYGIDLEQEI